tara:strand:+ start:540 stop:743 length:204 start_codon:yes stop_codon:yes gene_type:complete
MVEVKSWCDQSTQGYAIYGDNREEVEQEVVTLLSNYPNAGFGTNFDSPLQDNTGKWKAVGYRHLNCD